MAHAAKSEDVMRAEVLNEIVPLPGTAGFGTVLRSIHTAFLDRWSAAREEARRERERLKTEIISTTQAGRMQPCSPLDRASAVSWISRASPV
jgi:hypothetical protein